MTTFYAFQARGEASERGPAPSGFQAIEGITPRTVRAETIHVRSRTDWRAFHRAARVAASELVGAGKAGEARFWFSHAGRVYRVNVERNNSLRTNMLRPEAPFRHGTMIEIYPAMITARPRRALIAEELAWAAKYRANAMRDRLNGSRKAYSVRAARHSIAEARALFSALDKLP